MVIITFPTALLKYLVKIIVKISQIQTAIYGRTPKHKSICCTICYEFIHRRIEIAAWVLHLVITVSIDQKFIFNKARITSKRLNRFLKDWYSSRVIC